MSGKSKALSMLGTTVREVQTMHFVERCLSQSGRISSSADYLRFWDTIVENQSVNAYLQSLIQKVLEKEDKGASGRSENRRVSMASGGGTLKRGGVFVSKQEEEEDKKKEKEKETWKGEGEDEDSIGYEKRLAYFNTIFFLCLFYPVNFGDPEVRKGADLWKERFKKKLDFSNEVCKVLNPNYIESDECTRRFVGDVLDVPGPGDDCSPSDLLSDSGMVSRGLLYYFLRRRLSNDRHARLVFDYLLNMLRFSKKERLTNETQVLVLLHVLRQFITLAPGRHQSFLEQALKDVEFFTLWPLPYGQIAQEVLELIQAELKTPGSAFTERLAEEWPDVVQTGGDRKCSEQTLQILADPAARNFTFFETLFYFSHEKLPVTLIQVKRQLLLAILQRTFDNTPDEFGLEAMSDMEVERVLSKVMEITRNVLSMPSHEAREFRLHGLSELLGIVPMVETTEDAPKDEGSEEDKEKKKRGFPGLGFLRKRKDEEFTGSGGRERVLVDLPDLPVNIHLLNTKLEDHNSEADTKKAVAEMFRLSIPKSGKTGSRVPVRVCLVGGDEAVHHYAKRFVELRYQDSPLVHGRDVHLYLLPLGRINTLAAYIAQYDIWYRRHVFVPYQASLPLIPHMEPSNNPRNYAPSPMRKREVQSSVSFVSPMDLYGEGLQCFVREARNPLEVRVYVCECWREDGSLVAIPFCMRAELGIWAYRRRFQLTKNFSPDATLQELQLEKSFKYVNVEAEVEFVQMNLFGRPRDHSTKDTNQFHSLIVSNVPRVGDKGTPANPSVEWLEMHTVDVDDLLKRRKSRATTSEGSQGVSQHIGRVEIRGVNNCSFDVLLDEELYGPFTKIKISPSFDAHGNHITMTFMTFFPMDV